MDELPRVVLSADSFGSSGGDSSVFEYVALAAFVGVFAFCVMQAIVAPRRTFCAQKAD